MPVEVLRPGVFVQEVASTPVIVGSGVSTGGFVGVAEKGPVDKALFITNFGLFKQKYGNFITDGYLAHSVKLFFDNGGTRCFVARVAGTSADTAFANVNDHGASGSPPTADPTIVVTATSPGAWGNDVEVNTIKIDTTLAANVGSPQALTNGQTSIFLDSVEGLEVGDLLLIGGTAVPNLARFVQSINTSTKEVMILAASGLPVAGLADGSRVIVVTTHRNRTTLTTNLTSGSVTAEVANSTGLVVGQDMYFSDGTNQHRASIASINGKVVTLDAAAASTISSAGLTNIVTSLEFDLKVFEDGVFQESHKFLSVNTTNKRDYVANRLAGESNQSTIVTIVLATPASANGIGFNIPVADLAKLSGGVDDNSVTSSDLIGDTFLPTKRGLQLFTELDAVRFIAIPGETSVAVQQGGIDFCENLANKVFVGEVPFAISDAQAAYDFRQDDLNRASSYGTLYFPWLQMTDPIIATQTADVPPSGAVMGVMSNIAAVRGPHVPPANVALRGILNASLRLSDKDQELLNPIGVNCIRVFSGEGIRVFGARTLYNVTDGRHFLNVRNLLIYIEESIKQGNRGLIFNPINSNLFSTIKAINEEFLRTCWSQGMLYPSNDKNRAFFVKCDEETTSTTDLANGTVNVQIGISPPPPAEAIVFSISLSLGGIKVLENTPI